MDYYELNLINKVKRDLFHQQCVLELKIQMIQRCHTIKEVEQNMLAIISNNFSIFLYSQHNMTEEEAIKSLAKDLHIPPTNGSIFKTILNSAHGKEDNK